MKKKIIAVIAFVLVVTGVPFCAIKGDEAARRGQKRQQKTRTRNGIKKRMRV